MMFTGAAMVALTLTGCALSDTTAIPQGNNQFKMISTAKTERNSIQGALNKANKMCGEKNQKAIVVSSKTDYQGVDKTTGAVTDTAIGALAALGGKTSNGILPSTRRDDDYKTTMVFKCR